MTKPTTKIYQHDETSARAIGRAVDQAVAIIPAGTSESDVIKFQSFAGIIVHLPPAWTAASIGFKVSSSEGGNFQILKDKAGVIIEITTPVANESYVGPAKIYGCHYIKLYSQTAGVAVNQSSSRNISLDMKG